MRARFKFAELMDPIADRARLLLVREGLIWEEGPGRHIVLGACSMAIYEALQRDRPARAAGYIPVLLERAVIVAVAGEELETLWSHALRLKMVKS